VTVNIVAFNGDICCDLSVHFLELAEKEGAIVPLIVGHRIMGTSLLLSGNIAESQIHLDRAMALYDPAQHRPLATRFAHDLGVSILCYQSLALWMAGYPDTALADANRALKDAREVGHAATLMIALWITSLSRHILCGDYARANALVDELVALAGEKGAVYWKAHGMALQGPPFCSNRQNLGRNPNDYFPDSPRAVQLEQHCGRRIYRI
jgi:predicted ATPase